jgi:hypothetical protein
MEQNVEFFRLLTGEDLVSEYEVSEDSTHYILYNPCKVVYLTSTKPGFLSISLMQWIFSKLCVEQTFNLPINQVLIKSTIAETMIDHYFQSVEYFNKNELQKKIEFDSPIIDDSEEYSEAEESLDLLEKIMEKIGKTDKRKLH